MKNFLNKSINANYFSDHGTLTGKLLFRKDGFLFNADNVNGTLQMNHILYSDLLSVEYKNTLGIVPNGLLIKTKNAVIYSYAMFDRKDVKAFLDSKIAECNKR